jgi:hypothetical protein
VKKQEPKAQLQLTKQTIKNLRIRTGVQAGAGISGGCTSFSTSAGP